MNIAGIGYNQSINNYYNRNNSCRMRNNSPQFKGTVAPEFVDYVNQLREDSLKTAKGEKKKQNINAMADNIINTAEDTVQNYLHPDAVLTVDKEMHPYNDTILFYNKSLKLTKEHCSQQGIAFVHESWSPIDRLKHLNALTNENMYIQSVNTEVHSLVNIDRYLEKWDDESSFKDAVKNSKEVLTWNHDNGPRIHERYKDSIGIIDDNLYQTIMSKIEAVEQTKKW